jgi:hypothetical protein
LHHSPSRALLSLILVSSRQQPSEISAGRSFSAPQNGQPSQEQLAPLLTPTLLEGSCALFGLGSLFAVLALVRAALSLRGCV